VSEVNTSLVGWLVNHIRCEDKKLAIYLQQQK
jgi:hemerythrin